MTEERISYLLHQYLHRQISEAELHELTSCLLENEDNAAFYAAFEKGMTTGSYPESMSQAERDAIFQQITGEPVSVAPVRKMRVWYAVAAAVLLFVVCGWWFVVGRRGADTPPVAEIPAVHDVLPGGNRAVLQLADGSEMVLDSLADGLVTEQEHVKVVKLRDGELSYSRESGVGSRESIQFNTLRTPKGGQYQLVLPDGTKIWLNAASSICFPTTFNAKERRVTVTGESYFEVAKDRSKPFIVDIDGKSTVEVLGTHFNINAYSDEDAIRTTLLEGKVKVSTKYEVRSTNKTGSRLPTPDSRLLTPGEQSIITDHITVTNQISIDNIMAWKNGFFNLQNQSVQEVARQLERWYDIEVKFEGTPPAKNFQGKLGRGVQLSAIMNWFTKLGIHNKLEGRTLTLSAGQ